MDPNSNVSHATDIELKDPRRSCKRCHGRGIEGYDDYGKAVPCSCVFRPTSTPPRRSQDLSRKTCL